MLQMASTLIDKENCPVSGISGKDNSAKDTDFLMVDAKKAFVLRVKRMNENATLPTYGSLHAAGADLYSSEEFAIPSGCYGRVAPRSGLAAKHFIGVGAGVIDSDYRGEVKVLLFNFGEEDYQVRKGDRIAQLICERYEGCQIVEEEKLTATDRGAGGFGSTGV
ncbi:unnamed protein product [Enterobius vermicularis]|uniref:Deoxyuridine 5'-triphosphate nucleotidohydrolase n=1 Tax=Enterobius vermicularis TaxID=51028 RepID=A0A0N4V6B1_ENTVE|nr:unnamed protein product [Enterobius vermicularis]